MGDRFPKRQNLGTMLLEAAAGYESILSSLRLNAVHYKFQTSHTRGFSWAQFVAPDYDTPQQGWKLHVSISSAGACQTLDRVCQCLIAARATFKTPSTLEGLLRVNSGQAGVSQIGKGVTVYPRDDGHLISISAALSKIQFDRGPVPPSDLQVHERPGQSIRYGAFTGAGLRWTSLGRPYVAILDETKREIEDSRDICNEKTPICNTPLPVVSHPDLSEDNAPIDIGGDRFIPIGMYSNGARFRVDLALRVSTVRVCVIKRARRGVGEDLYGNCAARRLENEANVLSHLQNIGIAPKVIAFSSSNSALVIADVKGTFADKLVGNAKLRLLPKLANALAELHQNGFIHRDAKLANCAVTQPNHKIVLIDFELAAKIGDERPIAGGTTGYIPPEGLFAKAAPSYDVFALGSSLSQWALNFDPGRLPQSETRERILKLLHSFNRKKCAQIYAKLSHPNPQKRPSARQAAQLLEKENSTLIKENRRVSVKFSKMATKRWAQEVTRRSLPALNHFAEHRPEGCVWRNSHLFSDVRCTSINIGASGILIGLVYLLANGSREQALWDLIERTAKSLAHRQDRDTSPGLFTGDCGVAVALAAAGRCLGEPSFSERALEITARSVTTVGEEWDLFSGAAGIVHGATFVAALTKDSTLLGAMSCLVDRLLNTATRKKGVICWPATPAYDPERKSFLGAAHGAAGVGLALATWARAVGTRPDATDVAREVFSSIHTYSQQAARFNIPETMEGGVRPPQYWCHGVAGFLWCLLQGFPDRDELGEPIKWAIQSLHRTTPIIDLAPMCHGLAGTLDTWNLIAGWSSFVGDKKIESRANNIRDRLVHSLRCVAQEYRGGLVWGSEDATEITPDLWVGFLGPTVTVSNYGVGRCSAVMSVEGIVNAASAVERQSIATGYAS
jgi:serine/threonine protein kinase